MQIESTVIQVSKKYIHVLSITGRRSRGWGGSPEDGGPWLACGVSPEDGGRGLLAVGHQRMGVVACLG